MRHRAFVAAGLLSVIGSLMVVSNAPVRATDFTLPSATDGSLIRLVDHAGKLATRVSR